MSHNIDSAYLLVLLCSTPALCRKFFTKQAPAKAELLLYLIAVTTQAQSAACTSLLHTYMLM